MTRKILPYNPELVTLAKELRNNSTLAEVLLWNQIKRNKLGVDFHRQKPIDNYIVDFYCPDLLLVIEIDGNTHRFKAKDDLDRQQKLERLGVKFIRFTDKQVKQQMDEVLRQLRWKIEQLKEKDKP